MEIDEIKTLWQLHETRLDQTTKMNLETLDLVQTHRVKSTVKQLWTKNIIVLVLHSLALIVLLAFLALNYSNLTYAISGLVLLSYYTLLFTNTYHQISELNRIEESNNDVVSMQSSLAKLRTHRLNFMRFSVITIPAFLSFPVVVPKGLRDFGINAFSDFDIIQQTNGKWWLVEVIAFIILIPLGIWFYKEVTPKNSNKLWIKRVISKASSKKVTQAIQYLHELEEMKTGKI